MSQKCLQRYQTVLLQRFRFQMVAWYQPVCCMTSHVQCLGEA